MTRHKPVYVVEADVGNGWQTISNKVIKWNANTSVTAKTNTSSLTLDYSALQQIQSLKSSSKIKILAGYDLLDLKLLFDGLVRSIKKSNTSEEFDIEADDYSVFMLDRFITDAFENEKAVDIIKDILQEKIPEYTWDDESFDDNDFVVEKIAFEDKTIIEIIEYICNLIGFNFWIESDGLGTIKFFCKVRKSNDSDFVLERGKNLKGLIYIEDKSQMFNRVIVEGDKREFSTNENFNGDGVSQEVYLRFKPRNVRVLIDGVLLKGGVEGITQNPDFTVDYYNRKISFTVSPAYGSDIEVDYAYDVPIKVEATDLGSIAKYGEKVQFIKNKNIKEKTEAKKYAREYIKQYGKPQFIAEAETPASTEFSVGDVITVKDLAKGINNSMQVLECNYTYSKTEGFNSSLKLAHTSQTGTNVLKDIILRLKQLEELLKGDVEVVTKLTSFQDTITIRIKRITAKKRALLEGFTWSKEGVWNHNDWGVDNYVGFETFFEYGDKDVLHRDTSFFAEEDLSVHVIFSPELDKIFVWSYGNWNKDSWSGETEFVIPTPTILKKIIDDIKFDIERSRFELSIHPDFSDATLWSLNGGSPPYWSKLGFTRTIKDFTPAQAIHDKKVYDELFETDRLLGELSINSNIQEHTPIWSLRYTWSNTGQENILSEETQLKYTQDLHNFSDRLILAQEFLSYLDDELVFSRSRWNKSQNVDVELTENIILKEIDNKIISEDKVSFQINDLQDGFFWGVRGWSTDDWGNIPKGLSQQDIQQRKQTSGIVSSDKTRVELTFDSVFKGWSIKLWSKDGWISYQQPTQTESTHEKTKNEELLVSERESFETILATNIQTNYVHSKSKWSDVAWS
jgi:hypothetical protein